VASVSNCRPWYKRFPADFIAGTLALSLEEKGAYSVCLDLIYDRGGPIPDDAQWISRVCGCSVRKWKTIRETLVNAGKLVASDGTLSNDKARKLLENSAKEARKLSENGAKGAEKTNEKRESLQQNNNLEEKGPSETKRQSIFQKLEARSQIERKGPPLPPTALQTNNSELQEAVSDWNDLAEQVGLAKVARLTPARAKKLRRRLDDCDGINGWTGAMRKVAASEFLTGKNDRGWRADFDFVLQEKSFTKLMEGGYDRKKSTDRDDAKRILAATVARRMEAGRGSDGPEGGSPCEPGGGEGRDAGGWGNGNRQGAGQADDDFPHTRLVVGSQ
jgi:uncharacterized protein YdaU (DUF1376 family)